MNESVRAETFPLQKINPASYLPVIPCINKKTHSKAAGLQGGDEWNRTIDTRIFSPLLYQLSYITLKRGCKSRRSPAFCNTFTKIFLIKL